MNKKKLIKLSENDLHNIINESVKILITESQESKSQSEAIKYLMQKMNWDKERANNFVRNDLRQDITALRDKNIAKFTLGVTRMFCDRQLSDAHIISNLNATLKLLSAHLNEYDRNLNGISAQELIDKFAQTRQDNIDAEKGEIDSMDFSQGSRYQIVPINSFEEAQDYYEYTNPYSRWCLTHMNDMFDSYTKDGINQIYFCLCEGFENEPCEVGENAPLDDYGLSMLSVIVNENGELAYCTTRWNHDNGGSDSSMSAKEISQVVGVNFYQVFKPNNKWQDMLSEVKEKISHGVPYYEIFDEVGYFKDGYAWVELNRKHNFINTNGEFISDQWFDGVNEFRNGYAWVKLNRKHNFINTEGQLVSPNQWFDEVSIFVDGYARVKLDGQINFINTNGELFSKQWFDEVGGFIDGYAQVRLDEEGYNFINTNGDLVSDQWFEYAYLYKNGIARVELDGEDYNFNLKDGTLYNISENKQYNNMAKKQLIRLTEGDLHVIIKESVGKILKEYFDDFDDNLLYADPYYGENQNQSYDAYPSYNDYDMYNHQNNDDDEIEVTAIEDNEYENFKVMGINAQKVRDGYQGKIKIYFPNMQQTITDNFRYRGNDLVSNCEFGINYPQDIENQLSEYVSDYLSK